MAVNQVKHETKKTHGAETAPGSILSEIPFFILDQGIMTAEEWNQLPDAHKATLAQEAYGPDWESKIRKEREVFEPGGGKSGVETRAGVSGSTPEKSADHDAELDKFKAEFERAKSELGSIERGDSQIIESRSGDSEQSSKKLSAGEKERIFQEKGGSQNLGVPNFFGYNPPPQFANSVNDLADNGDVSESRTWLASLIRKIWISMRTE